MNSYESKLFSSANNSELEALKLERDGLLAKNEELMNLVERTRVEANTHIDFYQRNLEKVCAF